MSGSGFTASHALQRNILFIYFYPKKIGVCPYYSIISSKNVSLQDLTLFCTILYSKLYTALLNDLRKRNIHAVLGGIALPNKESQHLHEKFGFKKVAHFTEVGYKFNKWIDVGYWELLLK